MKYCTGIRVECQHWGMIPKEYNELKHTLKCPECGGYMGSCGRYNPVKDAGYRESNEVTPIVINEETE